MRIAITPIARRVRWTERKKGSVRPDARRGYTHRGDAMGKGRKDLHYPTPRPGVGDAADVHRSRRWETPPAPRPLQPKKDPKKKPPRLKKSHFIFVTRWCFRKICGPTPGILGLHMVGFDAGPISGPKLGDPLNLDRVVGIHTLPPWLVAAYQNSYNADKWVFH